MEAEGLRKGSSPTGGGEHPMYRRVVVKAGTNLLTGGTDRLDLETMAGLVGQIARAQQTGHELILVSSGAVAAGRHTLSAPKGQKDTPFRQVLASVGQSRLMHAYEQLFGWHNIVVAQVLVTRNDLAERASYLNIRNTFNALLELGAVPIVNENDVVAVEEITGQVIGDNDNLSAMVAALVDADLLLILTDIAGLYTADPHKDKSATLIPRVERIDAGVEKLAGRSYGQRGVGGMVTKVQAAKHVTAAGIPMVIANGQERDVLRQVLEGSPVGTFFVPSATRLEARKRWFLSGLSTRGKILVDPGAVQALRRQHKSLLPAGVQGIQGDFQRGDIVYIAAAGGDPIACGITNYSAKDLQKIKGLRSDQVHTTLGYQFGAEVVHRNNLVMLSG